MNHENRLAQLQSEADNLLMEITQHMQGLHIAAGRLRLLQNTYRMSAPREEARAELNIFDLDLDLDNYIELSRAWLEKFTLEKGLQNKKPDTTGEDE